MKKAILLVSFGTAYQEARDNSLECIARDLEMAGGIPLYQAYTSRMVVEKLSRKGIQVNTVGQAVKQVLSDGVSCLFVIPSHMIPGIEYQKMVRELENYREVNLFLRGIVPLVGFESTNVYYERHERFAGESKYPLKKMISFAVDGITSLSSKPIHLISLAGIGIFFFTVIYVLYLMIGHFFFGRAVQGWTSLMVSIWGVGGLELLAIGIIGEYVGKTYLETKSRPRYIVKEYLKEEEEGNEQA